MWYAEETAQLSRATGHFLKPGIVTWWDFLYQERHQTCYRCYPQLTGQEWQSMAMPGHQPWHQTQNFCSTRNTKCSTDSLICHDFQLFHMIVCMYGQDVLVLSKINKTLCSSNWNFSPFGCFWSPHIVWYSWVTGWLIGLGCVSQTAFVTDWTMHPTYPKQPVKACQLPILTFSCLTKNSSTPHAFLHLDHSWNYSEFHLGWAAYEGILSCIALIPNF